MTQTLARRLRRTLVVVGVVQLLVLGLALFALVQVQSDQQKVTRDFYRVLLASNDGFLRVVEIQEAAVAYLSDGDDADLSRLREAQLRSAATSAAELEQQLQGAMRALTALEVVRASAAEWQAELGALLGQVQEDGPQAVSAAEIDALQRDFAEVRRDYDAYLQAANDDRRDIVDRLQQRTSLLFVTVVVTVATSVLAGLVLYAALRTWVTRPLAQLSDETRLVRTGALDHVVEVSGPPEIVAVGEDVDAMRRGLVEQLAELERARSLLEQQADELRRSNRDLEQFAYVASHDLQEPLRKVSSFCQMLERRYKGQLDERADQYIAFAVDGAKRMQQLINDLLTFSRVGRLTEGFAEVPMDEVLGDALRNLEAAIEESGATVTNDPMPVVQGERRLLVQLLQNLIGNAVKFRGEAPPHVHVGVQRRDEECWEFCVSDNGIGIEPQYAERIFVIFQRLHPKAEYEGTGIGLALCKKIVEYHGGTIWLDTEPGKGTTFRWTLPVTPTDPLDTRLDSTTTPSDGVEQEEKQWTTAPK